MQFAHHFVYRLLLLALLTFTSCKSENNSHREAHLREWMREDDTKRVLCTTAMVRDLVERVGGGSIKTLTLIQGEHDPHSYQLVKGDDEKFLRADAIFYSGLGLEHNPSLAHYLATHPKAHSLGGYLFKKEQKKIIYIDGAIDPHAWMDVSLWCQTVPFVVETLSILVPEYKDIIKKNGEALISELHHVHKCMREKMQRIPNEKRYLVTTHDAFNYFARAYLAEKEEAENGSWYRRCMAPEGLAPESQLSTTDIHRLVEYLIAHDICCVFSESNVSRDSIKKLLEASSKKGHFAVMATKPLFADSMGSKGSQADTYMAMMQYDANTISEEIMRTSCIQH